MGAPRKDPATIQHGKYSTYCNWGCRCEDCRKAASAYMVAQRAVRAASMRALEASK